MLITFYHALFMKVCLTCIRAHCCFSKSKKNIKALARKYAIRNLMITFEYNSYQNNNPNLIFIKHKKGGQKFIASNQYLHFHCVFASNPKSYSLHDC